MLDRMCAYLHNYFETNPVSGDSMIYDGEYTITDSVITLPDDVNLLEGQRFRVYGSLLNDGVYTYHASGVTDSEDADAAEMEDETFTGQVWGMAVPRELIRIAAEASAWETGNADAADSPYQSESFGGYSYTLKSGTSGNSDSDATTWEGKYGSRIFRKWGKIA